MAWYYLDISDGKEDTDQAAPWYGYRERIKLITVEEGVTSIGSYAFKFGGERYYRINLPLSLEFWEINSFTSKMWGLGQQRVFRYSGSDKDWSKVREKLFIFIFNEDKTQVIDRECYHTASAWGRLNVVYYNGKEPEPYCAIRPYDSAFSSSRLEKGESSEFYFCYYTDKYTDARVEFRTQGDACEIEYIEKSAEGVPEKFKLTSITYGKFTVIAELVDPDGSVICSDEISVFSNVPEDMTFRERAEKFYTDLVTGIGWSVYMIRLLAYLLAMSIFG